MQQRKRQPQARFKRSRWFSAPQRIQLSPRSTVIRLGPRHSLWQDLYHWLITVSWPVFMGLIVVLYLVTNLLFAIAYLLGGDTIANARPGSLADAFFFSVQTMATIGYGAMYPQTLYSNILVAIEALGGLLGVALATGLMFARFSRPTARVLFSRVAVIVPYNSVPTLMFRTANQRGNQILEARLWVTLARDEKTVEGHKIRRLHDLKLIRQHTPFFALSWTAMHPIDQDSPFWGETPESLAESDAELVVTLTGTDETIVQTIHARQSYAVREILWNMRFVDILTITQDGQRIINYHCFHEVMPLDILNLPTQHSEPPLDSVDP